MSEKITVQSYLSKVNPIFEITLPSGSIFKLRKITARDFLKEGGACILQSSKQIEKNTSEQNKNIWEKLPEDQQLKQMTINDKIIVKAVIEPKLKTGKSSDIYLGVDDLSDEDYYALLKQVTEVMGDNNSLQTFCKEPTTTSSGCDSKKI